MKRSILFSSGAPFFSSPIFPATCFLHIKRQKKDERKIKSLLQASFSLQKVWYSATRETLTVQQ
jgi:G:T-mismatch repair DNA endonuclease (very short patch repair protein)